MAKKKIKPQSAKQKGRKLQKWVAEKISELTGYEHGTSGDDAAIESRPMGQSGTDIRMESHVLKEFPYSVECKAVEKASLPQWIKQAKENKIEGTDWLLVYKKSREKPVVVIDAKRFFEILKQKK